MKFDIRSLISILKEANSAAEIDGFRDDIISLIPCLEIMIGFDQKNTAHQYDLWEHSLQTVSNLPSDIDDDMVYLAALIHDIGKPDCQVEDEKDGQTIMHYYGHPQRSMEITRDEIIPGLLNCSVELTDDEQRRLLYYVQYHDDRVSLRIKHLRRHLRLGASLQEFQNLMKLQVADAKAHVMKPIIIERIEICGQLAGDYGKKLYEDILSGK